jgi:hypothetical protein
MQFLAVVMLIAFLNNSPNSSTLLSPPQILPWFIEHVAFEPIDLPSGVNVSVVTDENSNPPNEFIVFNNTSPIPLYVVGKGGEGDWKFDEISVEFPSGIGPVYKVVDGKTSIWSIKYNHPGTGYYFAWFKKNQNDVSIWLHVDRNKILSEIGTILDLDPRNRFGQGGDRPKDVIIPESQKVVLPIIYGTKEIQIPITVSYTLNTNYPSYSSNGDFFDPFIFCYIIVIFAAIAAGVSLVLKRQKYS